MERLLEAGADPTIRCLDGRDALEQVMFDKGDCGLELISYLHLMTKDKVEKFEYELPLLHKAVLVPREMYMTRTIRMLIQQGEDINALDWKLR